MTSHALRQRGFLITSPASFAHDVVIRARAWILNAVLDVDSHPHLVSTNSDETEISQAYVTNMFKSCDSFIGHNLKGLDLISFAMPKHRSSLLNKNAVPVVAILHGTHKISMHTLKAMFCSIEGLWSDWMPLYFGPGTMYKALEDHAMYKTFLDTSSTSQADSMRSIRVDYKGNSGMRQATIQKNTERSRIWRFDGVINSVLYPGLVKENVIFHDYLRQHIVSVWEQSGDMTDVWEFVSYAMQKERSSLLNGDSMPVRGIFVHRKDAVRLQSFQII